MAITGCLPTTDRSQPERGGEQAWAELDLLEADFDDTGWWLDGDWVEAAPFRAHVRQLISEYGLAWRTVAVLAEVPPAALAQLLRGRSGRPVARIHPLVARRLFQLTAVVVGEAAIQLIPADDTRTLLELLSGRGWSVPELAHRTGLPAAELRSVLDGRARCSQLAAATVRAAAQALHRTPAPRPAVSAAGDGLLPAA